MFSGPQKFIISDLNRIEFISAFRKKVWLGHTTGEKIQDVFSLFDDHIKNQLYKQLTITTKHFQAAEIIIRTSENPLRSLDAIHLGIASSDNLTFFSFDKVMNKAAGEFNIPIFKVESK